MNDQGIVLGLNAISQLIQSLRLEENRYLWIDLLVVAALAYTIYRFLKQRRTVKILWGIVILIVLWWIGQSFQLQLVNLILSWIITSILVAIPVVFQPELRSALEQVGRTTDYMADIYKLPRLELQKTIDTIVRAVKIMSKSKIGGLLIIQRQTGLREYQETGELLDAQLSTRLLLNIFTNNAPLHDGAVIIGGNKILAAACILPLSEQDPYLTLGTRHRAALGISEQTDAVALIVSEVKGEVSIATDGRLERIKRLTSLDQKLFRLLAPRKHPPS